MFGYMAGVFLSTLSTRSSYWFGFPLYKFPLSIGNRIVLWSLLFTVWAFNESSQDDCLSSNSFVVASVAATHSSKECWRLAMDHRHMMHLPCCSYSRIFLMFLCSACTYLPASVDGHISFTWSGCLSAQS